MDSFLTAHGFPGLNSNLRRPHPQNVLRPVRTCRLALKPEPSILTFEFRWGENHRHHQPWIQAYIGRKAYSSSTTLDNISSEPGPRPNWRLLQGRNRGRMIPARTRILLEDFDVR